MTYDTFKTFFFKLGNRLVLVVCNELCFQVYCPITGLVLFRMRVSLTCNFSLNTA